MINTYQVRMYVWLIDPNTHTTLSPLLLSPSPPNQPPPTHTHAHTSNPNPLFIKTYTSSSASTSYHQFPYYSPRTLHRLWDNTGHQWRLERDTCRRFCSLGRIGRWIFRRRGIGTGWGRWVSREGEEKIHCVWEERRGETTYMSNSPFTFRRIFRNINSSSRLIIPITDFIRIDFYGIKRLIGKSLRTLTKSSLIDEIVFVLTLLGLVCRGRNFLWRRRIVTLARTIAFGTALRTRDVEVEIFLVCGSAAFGEGCNFCFGVVEVEITLDRKKCQGQYMYAAGIDDRRRVRR